MNRLQLVRKLRALADDPAAAPNEREVARAMADALEARAPEPLPKLYPWQRDVLRSFGFGWWSEEPTPQEWDDLAEPIRTTNGFDLGAYSTLNLHRALHIMPDGSMNCKCHGPVHLIANGESLVIVHEERLA